MNQAISRRNKMVDSHMKEIAASARVEDCVPAGLKRPPTMSMPTEAQIVAKSMSFRLPMWSTTAEPGENVRRARNEGRVI
jgi:hypothetical protein